MASLLSAGHLGRQSETHPIWPRLEYLNKARNDDHKIGYEIENVAISAAVMHLNEKNPKRAVEKMNSKRRNHLTN